jgi:hypothetical protein
MVFIVISFTISYFKSRNILATDESQALMYLVDSEPLCIPYYNGQNHGGTGYLGYLKIRTQLDMNGKQCQIGMHYKYPILFLVG